MCMKLDAFAYLQKPLDIELLKLNHPKGQREDMMETGRG